MDREFIQYRWDLLAELVKTSFKLRYNNSLLGFLWVLLKPLMTFIILYIVWSRLLGNTAPNYRLYLLCGIIVYNFFSESINMGMNALLDKAHIILKVSFPRQVAVLSSTLMAVLNYSINMLILFAISIFIDKAYYTLESILYVLYVMFILYLLLLGLAFFTSIFLVYLRDLQNITEVGLQLFFWATPIFYSLDGDTIRSAGVDGTLKSLIAANPIGIIINVVRAAFIDGQVTQFPLMFGYLIFAICLCIAGSYFFSNRARRVAEAF